ncbi:DUF1212-domain-containing protein [Thozetella sp. PMI_491]|nr:DUF1212-domain-containing protein [Thozetella sp. PMI_491]
MGSKDYSSENAPRPQEVACELVQTHTLGHPCLLQRGNGPSQSSSLADPMDSLSRVNPTNGGVLGNLLKLYGKGDETAHAGSYQRIPGSPVRTPPVSRPSSPRARKSLHRRCGFYQHNSNSTLTKFIESTATLLPPPQDEVSDGKEKGGSSCVPDHEEPEKPVEDELGLLGGRREEKETHVATQIAEILSRHRYLVKLCRAMMAYGAPTHRLEVYMARSARVLGVDGQFFHLPGTMIISFDDRYTHTTEVKIVRAVPDIDLAKLEEVHDVYKLIMHEMIGVDEATRRLEEIERRDGEFTTAVRVMINGLCAAIICIMNFEGRPIDVPVSFCLGCFVAYLQFIPSASSDLFAHVCDITAAVLTSFLSRALGSLSGGGVFCFSSLAQSSVASVVPGYMFVCGNLELLSNHMVSGSARILYSMMYTIFIGYGITIGSVLYGYIDQNAISQLHCSVGEQWYEQRPNPFLNLVLAIPLVLTICILYQAKWSQMPVMLLVCIPGYAVNFFSLRAFTGSRIMAGSLSGLCIGLLANAHSRLGHYVNAWWVSTWERHVAPRAWRIQKGRRNERLFFAYGRATDPESQRAQSPAPSKRRMRGPGLAAVAMLPAILVFVPSGLALSGSLLAGVSSADMVTRNGTIHTGSPGTWNSPSVDLQSAASSLLGTVIQASTSLSVGLSISALLVYPLGKRRSGLFSF